MAVKLIEIRTDHRGERLPEAVYACATETGEIVSYKVRWREEDENGVRRQRSKSFSAKKIGSLDRALEVALGYAENVAEIVKARGAVAKVDAAAALTVDDVFKKWLVEHVAGLSPRYGEDSVRVWDRDIATRPIAAVRLDRLSRDPSIVTRFQSALKKEGIAESRRRHILKLLRAVLRWGRLQYPNALTVEFAGLFKLPPQRRNRLPYAADAVGIERIIEAILARPSRDDLRPLRDAAFTAAMGYTVAARPNEWRLSATWGDLHDDTVELQRSAEDGGVEARPGLKTGAHVALLLPGARDRIASYREALEERFGPQLGNGLVFQVLDQDGPVWVAADGGGRRVPLAMNEDAYNRWTARVWRPAREAAAQAPDAPQGLDRMAFYDLRHTAISMALHSTLVTGPHGMNLHALAGWAAHDIQTLQRYYAHLIVRYERSEPLDLEKECARARAQVEANPFTPSKPPPSPQREQARRRLKRRRAAAAPAPH
jgi:integrase